MRTLRLAVWCLALSACGGMMSPSVPLNREFTLAPGETATVAGPSLRVRFVEVRGDSRCPADAICITGGDAIVRIAVRSRLGGEKAYDLHTGSMQPIVHDKLTISLVRLEPYPFSARTIRPDEYRATLRVSDQR